MKQGDNKHVIEIRVMKRVRQYVTILGYKEFSNNLLGDGGNNFNQ